MWFWTQQKKDILLLTGDAPTIHVLLFSFMLLQMKKWNHIAQEHFLCCFIEYVWQWKAIDIKKKTTPSVTG